MDISYLSICSGIEAATVAWSPLGWRLLAVSEIDKFPCAVLAHHYPDVPNLGDMTEMDVSHLARVDVLVGGTPCQAFSVAGLRQSLDDARGNLTLSYVRLAHELANEHGLRNAVWENVPGVLSTKGRAAWRILDAQYFGLAQRRRRVFVVADFGSGADPAAVLLELEGVRGNPAPSREARKDVAPTISARTKGGGGLGPDFDLDGGLIEWPVQVAPTLNAHFGDKMGLEDQHALHGAELFVPAIAGRVAPDLTGNAYGDNESREGLLVAHALRADGFDASEDGTGRGTPISAVADTLVSNGDAHSGFRDERGLVLVAEPIAFNSRQDPDSWSGVTGPMDTDGSTQAIAFDTTQITSKENRSHPQPGDPRHPLAAGAHPPAIAFDMRGREGGAQFEGPHDTANIRAASGGSSRSYVAQTWAVRRLTPTECERLQGFPDGYTQVPFRNKTAADGPRYKALGNSMAVPVMRWIGERIDRFKPREEKPVASLLFFDWETQSLADLTVTGTLKYVLDTSTRPLLLSWAIDDAPIKLWCPDLSAELAPEVWAYVESRMADYGPPPVMIGVHLARDDGYVVAHNASFDRQVWQQIATPDYGFPELRLEQVLDSQAQCQASNLPGSLEWAGRMLGLGHKTIGGKASMKRFANRAEPLPGAREAIDAAPDRQKAVANAIEAWTLYLDYSVQDTELMRAVWKTTRPLDASEWQEYWVSERINDRGMLADLDVCRGAVAYREEEAAHVVEQIKAITNGAIAGPTFTAQINAWLYERLPDDLREFMVKERGEDGAVTRITGDKNVMTRLLEEIDASPTPPADEVVDLLETLEFGRASSAVKFQKIVDQEVDGRLTGSYVFNGAGQTGRYSSRGTQIHNLPRDYLKNELDVLDMVAAGVPIEKLREVGPVSSVLAKLIRPTFIAPEGKVLVWGDWSAIEARVNPWLADSRDAEEAVLKPFRESDADPDKPDLYVFNAAVVFDIDPNVLWERYRGGDAEAKFMRQVGKVLCLSLAFLGADGALKKMARGYKIQASDEEFKRWVGGWRERNRWARRFGDKAEEAAFHAMNAPMSVQKAGKLRYQFAPDLMGGTLVCFLPDGRPIVYPMAKIKQVEKFGKMQDTITYVHGMGRRALWNGLQIQGGTQATAASILRQTLVRLDAEETEAEVVLHTHDEVGGEVAEASASGFAERLLETMVRGWDWTEGLPLAAEISTSWYYTKSPPKH